MRPKTPRGTLVFFIRTRLKFFIRLKCNTQASSCHSESEGPSTAHFMGGLTENEELWSCRVWMSGQEVWERRGNRPTDHGESQLQHELSSLWACRPWCKICYSCLYCVAMMNRSASTQAPLMLTATQSKDWSITAALCLILTYSCYILCFGLKRRTNGLYGHILYANQRWKKQVDFVFVECNNLRLFPLFFGPDTS